MEKQLLKRISSLEKRVVDLYHKLKQQLVGPQGPQGVEGPQGPQGALGPVGPAGLEWQGLWDEDTSYAQDDAVGYAGASWFCISAVTGTNNDSPDNDTDHWALLAAQGAQGQDGAPGVQGPIGPQGPQGAGATQTLQQTVNLGNTITNGSVTSTLTATSFKVAATNSSGLTLNSNQITCKKSSNDFLISFPTTISDFQVATFQDATGTIAYLEDFSLNNNTTSALSLSTLNSQYPSTFYYNGFRVFCPNITGGGLVYTKTGASTWVSQSITTVS